MSEHLSQGNKMLTLHFEDRDTLYRSYMPFIENGGLFVKTNEYYEPGDQVFLLISLMDSEEKYPMAGKVVWIAPKNSATHPTGIGVQLSEGDSGRLRIRIENMLAGMIDLDIPTYTM